MSNSLLSEDFYVIQQLFDQQIYCIKENFSSQPVPDVISKNPETFKIPYRGGNSKNIAFIVESSTGELVSLEEELLQKTLTALKLSMEDISLFVHSGNQADILQEVISQNNPSKIVAFAEKLMLPGNKHQASILEGIPFLPCVLIKQLSADQQMKVQWWNSLKSFLS